MFLQYVALYALRDWCHASWGLLWHLRNDDKSNCWYSPRIKDAGIAIQYCVRVGVGVGVSE